MSATVTPYHRAVALSVLKQQFYRSVNRVVADAWERGNAVTFYAPTAEDKDLAAQLVADMEPQSELALAVGAPKEP